MTEEHNDLVPKSNFRDDSALVSDVENYNSNLITPATDAEDVIAQLNEAKACGREQEETPIDEKDIGLGQKETEKRPETKEVSEESETNKQNKPVSLTNEEVTEYTANLWKYQPIPTDEPEPSPEYINCAVKLPGSTITAARVRGKKHKHEGTNCDDWFEAANYEHVTMIAVSDGAGSKKLSRIGARESCKAAIGFLVKGFENLLSNSLEVNENIKLELTAPECVKACRSMAALVQQSVMKAFEAVEAAYYTRAIDTAYTKSLGRNIEFKDFSGTLLIAVIVPINPEAKEHLVISCQIGDGMIVVMNSKGNTASSLRLLGVPDSGDFSGETEFLTSSQTKNTETLQNRTKLYRGVVDTVMVMSDGVADDYFPNETEMRRLYYDLVVNGIISSGRPKLELSTISKEDLRVFKRIPDPLTYPWVNDPSVKVSLQYTKRIMQSTDTTLDSLWNDPKILDLSMIELNELEKITDPSERLKIWLDNYVERGSFDDRTLVIAQM